VQHGRPLHSAPKPAPIRAAAPVELAAKVAHLSRPESHIAPTRRVEVVETHMSYVFLGDAEVLKLKKPIRRDRADFKTLASRRRACAVEVRLNRRLAPDVYRASVPLTVNRKGRLVVGGHGRAVDHLVRMRRLAEDTTLEALVAARAARPHHIGCLVRVLEGFYRAAQSPRWGPATYRLRIAARFRAAQRRLQEHGDPTVRARADRLAAGQVALLARERQAVSARAERVREAHGDLRPEHVYLEDDWPRVIDCLEFDRELRFLDPASELSFLALELERLGAPGLALALFEAWREESDDEPPLPVLGLYRSLHAATRAGIALGHVGDGTAGSGERSPEAQRRRFAFYLDAAEAAVGNA